MRTIVLRYIKFFYVLFILITLFAFLEPLVLQIYRLRFMHPIKFGEKFTDIKEEETPTKRAFSLNRELKSIPSDSNYIYMMSTSPNSNDCYSFITRKNLQGMSTTLDTIIRYSNNFKVSYTSNCSDTLDLAKVSRIDRIKRKAVAKVESIGDISFGLEDSMKVNVSYKALLIISRKISQNLVFQIRSAAYPQGIPKTIRDSMPLSKKIFASLQPALADQFTVLRTDLDTVKTIDLINKDYVTWEWVITPLKVGVGNLVLKLSRVEVPKGDLEKFIPTKIIPVKVYADEKPTRVIISEFIREEWKWLVTSILGAIGWILLYRIKRKNKDPEA